MGMKLLEKTRELPSRKTHGHDPWLPPPHRGPIPFSGQGIPPHDVPVSTFINRDTDTWNLGGISHLIQPDYVSKIQSIHFRGQVDVDRAVWTHCKGGMYSVKAGYQWYHQKFLEVNLNTPGSSHVIDRRVWKLVWGAKVVPKVRLFLWRALSNAGATFANLYKKRLSTTNCCPICGMEGENFEHILLSCPWARAVWFGSSLNIRIDSQNITTLDTWLARTYSSFPTSHNRVKSLTLVCYLLWSIWKGRCALVYRGTRIDPCSTIAGAECLAREFSEAGVQIQAQCHSSIVWSPPEPEACKVNVDASWYSPGQAGVGIIIRDYQGFSVGGLSKGIVAEDAEEAEAMAIEEGMILAKTMGIHDIIVESDSLNVISDLKESSRRNWRSYPVLSHVRRLSSDFGRCSWNWVPRIANAAAHLAAQLYLRREGPQIWTTQPPLSHGSSSK